MTPLVRQILRDVRETRCRLNAIARSQKQRGLTPKRRHDLQHQVRVNRGVLRQALDEATELGIEITDGVRCEALFPFEHRWIGVAGDGRIRSAYFVYSDGSDTIREWCFASWPDFRHPPAAIWWNQFRPGQRVPGTAATVATSARNPTLAPVA